MKKKILIFVTLLAFFGLTLAGCSNDKKSVAQEANTTDTWSSIKKEDELSLAWMILLFLWVFVRRMVN